MVWGSFFEQLDIARGIANFASCMYATLYKTTSDVDITRNYRYRFWEWGPIATQHVVNFPNTSWSLPTQVVCQSLPYLISIHNIYDYIRLAVYLPLWKMMEFVSWDDDIPNRWKVIKFMFQITNQITSMLSRDHWHLDGPAEADQVFIPDRIIDFRHRHALEKQTTSMSKSERVLWHDHLC